MNKHVIRTHVRQQDQSDCGVASLLSVIKYYGGNKSIEQLRELSGTTKTGTTILGLYQSAQKLGFNVEGLEATTEWLKKDITPVILHVITENNLQHYVVCYGYSNDKFIIGDPGKGVVYYTENDLNKIWQSKALLKPTPNEKFIKVDVVKKAKLNWFMRLIEDDKPLLSIIFVLSIIVSVLGIGMAVYSQKLIDEILPNKEYEKVILGTILLFVILLARSGIQYLSGLFGINQSKNFNNRIIGHFYNTLLFLPKSFFDNRRIGELVARMDDTGRIQTAISQVVMELLRSFLMAIIGIVALFFYSSTIGLCVLISLPIYAAISYKYHKRIIHGQQNVMAANAHKSSNYINTMEGVTAIKTQNKENLFAEINKNIYGNFQQEIFNLGKLSISIQTVTDIIGVIFTIAILGIGSWLVISDRLSTGALMAVLGISGSLFPAITSLAFANVTLQGAKVAFNRMYEFTSIEPEYINIEKTSQNITFEKLEVHDVSYRFPGRKQILKNISFSLKKGETIAILGESGGGKTTLLNVLQGFYTPEHGGITLNDKNLNGLSLPDYRNILGIVPQEVSIFNGTLLDNLLMGGSEDEAKGCLRFCSDYGFDNYFSQFPQSYLTLLGEEGVNISGGQKQLIGLCRALFKKPKLLMLDEPTSAMDRDMENFSLSVLRKFNPTCGTLFVTHQLKIANEADKILILKNNTIESSGNRESLLATENLYSQLYNELSLNETSVSKK